jgi:hypothetical protein
MKNNSLVSELAKTTFSKILDLLSKISNVVYADTDSIVAVKGNETITVKFEYKNN